MRYRVRGPLAAATLCALPMAQAQAATEDQQIVRAMTSNDLYARFGNDRHYTNGLGLGWTSAADIQLPGWLDAVANAGLPDDVSGEPDAARVGFSIEQLIFTPEDIQTAVPITDDRPYAGWLYGRLELDTVHRGDGGAAWQTKLGVELGMIGPASLAWKTQDWWHAVIDARRPRGWSNQLSNEFAFNLTAQRAWRSPAIEAGPVEFDAIPYGAVSLGTVQTFGAAGLRMRFSTDLPDDFGPSKMHPDTVGSDWFVEPDGFAWYFFAGVEGRAVGHNLFLDGNTYRPSLEVGHRPLVGDATFGGAIILLDVRLSYQYVLRTRQFDQQRTADRFGSVVLDVAF